VSQLARLSAEYQEEHRRRPVDFVWGGVDRAEAVRQAVGGPGRRVLDIGCRYGALTRFYASDNSVVGVDVDADALRHAADLGIEPVWADVEEGLEFQDHSFDVVVAAELLEHLRRPRQLVEEAARVLRPGGTIVGSVPNSFRLKNRLVFLRGRPPESNSTHAQMFRAQDVLELLQGFERARIEYVAGRFVHLHPRLLANIIVFSARKPG
jgi:2-polyprenyl-3-methyl-5-hydroxy-6-metoxy-1,4-benzoquinol methylase